MTARPTQVKLHEAACAYRALSTAYRLRARPSKALLCRLADADMSQEVLDFGGAA